MAGTIEERKALQNHRKLRIFGALSFSAEKTMWVCLCLRLATLLGGWGLKANQKHAQLRPLADSGQVGGLASALPAFGPRGKHDLGGRGGSPNRGAAFFAHGWGDDENAGAVFFVIRG